MVQANQELHIILSLEHKELQEFSDLTDELMGEIERTKQELAIEERINLNLNFVRYKIKQIHTLVKDVLKKKHKLPVSADEEIALIMHYLVELEKNFFPVLQHSLKQLAKTDKSLSGMVSLMNKEFDHYQNIVHQLRGALHVENMPNQELETVIRKSLKLKANVQ